ncbi:Lon protease family protein [Desulfogranum mediterraneum]|uniref:Lon protease family protein n=1 Tax=Desulfogranum mediterraneum TaxID=160661 RepID=UPI000406EC55|nr:ATP-binding protein [Desulfogranum mediterraneum]
MNIRTITQKEAYHHCNADELPFETTAEVDELTHYIGQDRALEAVEFGISMPYRGFNLFVIGPEGSGRHSLVQSFINRQARDEPTPSDWCYVFNFDLPHKPLALEFSPKQAPVFRREMLELIEALKTTIPTVFEGDDYRVKKRLLSEKLKQRVDKIYDSLIARGREQSIAMVRNEQGVVFTPMDGEGNLIDLEAFKKLPAETQRQIEENIEKLHDALQKTVREINVLNREARERKASLKKETASHSIGHLLDTLKAKYGKQEKILHYLERVERQLIDNVDDFLESPDAQQRALFGMHPETQKFSQYEVNILLSHEEDGAPVVYEDMPTYQNLHGRIEHQARMGMLTTDFSLIRPGALHRANGGYIIIDARRLLMQPFAYEGLKRTLRSCQIRMEPIERLLGLVSTVTLEPEPIELDIKVVLIGEPMIYYLLDAYDPEFGPLFKVQADFEYDMERTSVSQQRYAALIAGLAREKGLLPLHKTAVARVIEEAARHAGDGKKMSLQIRKIGDLIKEADCIARKAKKECIETEHVVTAVAAAKRRGGRIQDRVFTSIEENIRHIETSGERLGQVNGLSVIELGGNAFGFPTRITAVTRPGKGDIIDIEREVELSGPIHSKGVMILAAFLNSRYARTIPFGMQASLVFEQSYGGVEGDSASCAELCALLSSLADLPIRQGLAVTGSISQKGEVQPVGGVNEKIEGFFEVCKTRGLTGSEGVLIPETNIRHLMLNQEVVEAIARKQFSIYPISTVDEAISLLTGREAGESDSGGVYPEDSVNGRVEATLLRFARDLQKFKNPKGDDDKGSPDILLSSR